MDTDIFRSMSYGVYVVTTMDGERPVGCIANSIMQITSSPATVMVSMNHNNYTNGCIEKSGAFAFSILSEESDPGLIGTFGFRSGRDTDKFENVSYEMVNGLPVVKDCCGCVACRVIDKLETATHTVFLGEVIDAKVYDSSVQAMTYAYYHSVIKGKSPKNAPTYLQEKKEEREDGKKKIEKYVCQVCGYIYEGETLPENYICPVCGVDADNFIKKK